MIFKNFLLIYNYDKKKIIIMKILQNFKSFNENIQNDESGEIILNINGKKTTWYFVEDAIKNGILEEYLDLSEEEIEKYGDEVLNFKPYNIEELSDIILDDFDKELKNLFQYLLNKNEIKEIPSIYITGIDDDGDDCDLQFDLD
jgi:hypothetical protein